MDETLKQLGELLLSSIPAIFGLLIVWAAYRLIVYTRLQQVLAERQGRAEGAIQQAQEGISKAAAGTPEDERLLREARAPTYPSPGAPIRPRIEGRTNP